MNIESQTISPLILSIFAEAKNRLEVTGEPELRLSYDLDYCAGMAQCRGEPGNGLILLDAYLEDYLGEDGIRYVIGHELGHLLDFTKYSPEMIDTDSLPRDDRIYPNTIVFRIAKLFSEIVANMCGVCACRSVDIAVQTMDILSGKLDFKRKYYDSEDDGCELPLLFWDRAVEMRALKLLHGSTPYFDLISPTSFEYGTGMLTYDEYWEKISESAGDICEYDPVSDKSIADCIAAALWILKSDLPVLPYGEYFKVYMEESLHCHSVKFDEKLFLSKKDAFASFDISSDKIRDFVHPFKHDAFQSIVKDTFRMEDDHYVAEDFIFYTGEKMGVPYHDILFLINYYG